MNLMKFKNAVWECSFVGIHELLVCSKEKKKTFICVVVRAIIDLSLSFQDDFPLASLPLLGYAVSQPEEEDGIQKDYVFKLQFKNHVYFFRAESEYTYER